VTKFTHSATELKNTLEHVYYEIDQLIETLVLTNNVALNNALVESCLIHVRTLLDFFQRSDRIIMKGNELDDVLSLDYRFPPQPVRIPPDYQDRLNKDLAHLTYSRAQRLPTEKPWPHDKVVLPILMRSNQFGKHIILNYLPTNCPEKLMEWQTLVEKINTQIVRLGS
jgi:hypothetical protein